VHETKRARCLWEAKHARPVMWNCEVFPFFQRCVFITFIRLLLPAHKNSDVNTSQNLWLHAALLILFRGMNMKAVQRLAKHSAACRDSLQ
jgi:hypothetical protein